MGLPAFDMSAFETAQEAISARPRAVTTIFMPETIQRIRALEDAFDPVRQLTDDIIATYARWRLQALAGLAQLRLLAGQATYQLSLDELREMAESILSQAEELRHNQAKYKDVDSEAILIAHDVWKDMAGIPSQARKFVRKEIRRVERMASERFETYDRLISSVLGIHSGLVAFIDENSVASADSLDAEALQAHVGHSLARVSDLDGVSKRTAERMKRYTKVAAYLAR